jgi:hypothetical protein
MTKQISFAAALCLAIGCSSPGTEPATLTSVDSFEGTWRSVTAQAEFVGLTIQPKSSEQGALGMRLTFSGVYWDGSGRIEGDSLVAQMMLVNSPTPNGVLIARVEAGDTLRAELRSDQSEPLVLRFVRDQ